MRPLTNRELHLISEQLQSLVGAQLQEVQQNETEFGLGFYHEREIVWVWFDLDPRAPMLLLFQTKPPRPKLNKPLLLFARAHLVGRRLQTVRTGEESGRIVEFRFFDPEGETKSLEARLFPHGQNISITSGEKQIFFSKPKDLSVAPVTSSDSTQDTRSILELRDEWMTEKGLRKQASSSGLATATSSSQKQETEAEKAERLWQKNLQKKSQALEKIRADIESKDDPIWRKAGDWLKAHASLESIPSEFKKAIDLKKNLSWNIENCFAKAKANERKIEGSRERLRIIEKEIETLKSRGPQSVTQQSSQGPKAKTLLEKADVRGRKFSLGDDLEAYVGKNAADNLSLLRRAQPHDLWLHLRDYPGSHAIVRMPKNRKIKDSELNEIGRWVALQSLRKSETELSGLRFDLIVAECRFVRPIKGDKLGRVNYQNDRLFVVRF